MEVEVMTRALPRLAGAVAILFVCGWGCGRELQCGTGDAVLQPGESVFLGGKTYRAVDRECCVAIRDGELVTDCESE
jgi:hypothetical protein